MRPRRALLAVVLVATVVLTACGPEAARDRGGDDGADVGNRGDEIQLTGDEDRAQRIYDQTPRKAPANAGQADAGE